MKYEYLVEDCVAIAKENETKITKKVADIVVRNVFDNIMEALKNGEGISIRGFGTFKPIEKKARTYIEPRTHKPIKKEASVYPKFTPSSLLKESLNG
jgi:nucleoid DNA-binding protein